MKVDWRNEWPMWAMLVVLFVLGVGGWNGTPDRIPVHWGLTGGPDRWGGRFEGLMSVPLIGLGLYLLMLFLPRIDPARANYAAFAPAYLNIRLLLVLFLTALEAIIVLVAHGRRVDIGAILPLLVGVLLVLVGNLLGMIRPNWFVGIRTPWTLTSKESWTRTHRAGRWVLMAAGLLLMSCALVRPPAYEVAVVIVIAACLAGLVIYSYLVWRRDPARTPPAGSRSAGS